MTVNKEYIILTPSGTFSSSYNTKDVSSAHGVGVIVVVDVQSIVGGSLIATVQGKDGISGKYYNILSSAAIISSGTSVLTVYPSATAATNVTASQPIPYTWRVQITAASGTAAYTIGANLID